MLLKNIPLTKKDFEELQWEDLVKKSDKKECFSYFPIFFAKAQEAKVAGEAKAEEIFILLGGVTSMMLKESSTTEPFAPMFVKPEYQSAVIDDFCDEHLRVLSEIVFDILDPEIRARIADILWIKKRDIRIAELAIKSYLESAIVLEDPIQWTHCAERIERAFRLGASLGKNAGYLDQVISHIEAVLDKYNGEDPKFLSNKLMGFLLEQRKGDGKKYSLLSEKLAKRAESNGDWYRARTYWETKAQWYSIEKDETNKRAALIQAAETYVKDAEAAIKREKPSHMIASAHLQHAIEAYRRIGGEKERLEELHRILLEYQEKSTNELEIVSTEINLTNEVKKAIERVKGKKLHEAIFELALIINSPGFNDLKNQVQELAKEYPIRHLFNTVAINEKGKVTDHRASLFSNNSKEIETAMRANMFEQAKLHQTIHIQGIIEPARNQINLEHNIRLSDFLPIVSNNPLIPEGREHIYAQGLHAGMIGDFLLAAHLLIPQFENSIRYVLAQRGILTSGIDSEGVQDEHSLNKTMYLPEMIEIFGEDITFDLQGLLVERFGANLRNRMAHGLIPYNAFYSVEVCYLWWLVLRLCCLPMIMKIKGSKAQQSKVSTIERDDIEKIQPDKEEKHEPGRA
jgi:hypothetical protein